MHRKYIRKQAPQIHPHHFLREARKVPDNESDDESDDASCGGEASGRLCFAGLPRSLGIHYPDLHCPGNEDELLSTPLGAGFDPSTGPLTTAFQNGTSGRPTKKRPWRTYKDPRSLGDFNDAELHMDSAILSKGNFRTPLQVALRVLYNTISTSICI